MPLFIGPLITFFIAAFGRLMATQAGRWVVMALGYLGLSLGTHTLVITPIIDQLISMASTTGTISQYISYFNFDKVITMITSAYAMKHSMSAGKAFLSRLPTAS